MGFADAGPEALASASAVLVLELKLAGDEGARIFWSHCATGGDGQLDGRRPLLVTGRGTFR